MKVKREREHQEVKDKEVAEAEEEVVEAAEVAEAEVEVTEEKMVKMVQETTTELLTEEVQETTAEKEVTEEETVKSEIIKKTDATTEEKEEREEVTVKAETTKRTDAITEEVATTEVNAMMIEMEVIEKKTTTIHQKKNQTPFSLETLDSELNNGPLRNSSRIADQSNLSPLLWVEMKDQEDLLTSNSITTILLLKP